MYKTIAIISLVISMMALGYAKYVYDVAETNRIIEVLKLGENQCHKK